ncbi:hypothetical protein BKA67DRAFT_264865 [Truncatella angustata]|uniref:Uncharacterized protein n=1 Tax=Truncatella angustata TaxID=152316 RepID=A0A9P8ZWN5_9PEZI|nr:uncharacterized protein BKA67DRAFT_264865 [Truncatella angustata]KAH6653927.1 hypothetical protein BKA67DRAFT_264865 [Truncatella angustata]
MSRGSEGGSVQIGVNERGVWTRLRQINPFAHCEWFSKHILFLILWIGGSFYTIDYIVTATIPDILDDLYKFNALYAGHSYLNRSLGSILGAWLNDKLKDHDYKWMTRSIGWAIDNVTGDDMEQFSIERVRSRGCYILLFLNTSILVSYAWELHFGAHVGVFLAM